MSRRIARSVISMVTGALVILACVPALAGPQRVVSADLCSDEYVFRLVPHTRIAALSWLAGDRSPVVSTIADDVKGFDLIHPSTEEVLKLRPDVVVMFEGSNPRLRAHLAEAGIRVVDVPYADSMSAVRSATMRLGLALDNTSEAATLLKEMDRDLAQAHARAPKKPVTTLIYEPNGYTAGTLVNEILSAAGLTNAAPKMTTTRAGTIPIEAVVADAPQLLILNGNARGALSKAELVLHHPALSALHDTTMMISLETMPLLCAGPWSALIAPELANLGLEALVHNRSRNLGHRPERDGP